VTKKRQSAVQAVSPDSRTAFDTGIEALWLAALALVPVVFNGRDWFYFFSEPKPYVLHFAALSILVLWSLELLLVRSGGGATGSQVRWDLVGWARRSPARWALIAAASLAFWQVLSTLLSLLPGVSFLGRDPNSGGDLYSSLSYTVVFFAIALRLRTFEQVKRIFLTVSAVGGLVSLYAVLQHFGWDPIGHGAREDRVYSSLGNPIYLGAYLVITLPLTLALTTVGGFTRRWLVYGLLAISFGLQLAALFLTQSRGPLAGAAVGLTAFAAAALIWAAPAAIRRGAVTAIVGAAVALLILVIPSGEKESALFGTLARAGGTVQEASAIGRLLGARPAAAGSEAPQAEADSAGRQFIADSAGGTFGIRVQIWNVALGLAMSWKSVVEEPGFARAMRFAFGYGPDMVPYAYPVGLPVQQDFIQYDNAHNFLINALLEHGFGGLALLLAFLLLAGLCIASLVRRRASGGRSDDFGLMAALGLGSALLARYTEQLFGLGRPADLLTCWVALGVAVALHRATEARQAQDHSVRAGGRPARSGDRRTASPPGYQVLPGLVAVPVLVGAIALFLAVDVQALRASRLGVAADAALDSNMLRTAFEKYRAAARTNPHVEDYRIFEAVLALDSSRMESDDRRALATLALGYETLAQYEKRNPLSYDPQRWLVLVLAEMAERGETAVAPELERRAQKLLALMPPYPVVRAFAASALARSEQYEQAIKESDRVLAETIWPYLKAQALWTKGAALASLDRNDEAVSALEGAVAAEPDGTFTGYAARSLVILLDSLGRQADADKYRGLAR
jgi:O-antigen ligase